MELQDFNNNMQSQNRHSCQWNEGWLMSVPTSTPPYTCQCKKRTTFLMINVLLPPWLYSMIHPEPFAFSDVACPTPEEPPAEFNMKLAGRNLDPVPIGQVILDIRYLNRSQAHAFSLLILQTARYVCKDNMVTTNNVNVVEAVCNAGNQWTMPSWPTCQSSKAI